MISMLVILLIIITLRLIRLDYDYRTLKAEFKLRNKELEIVRDIVFGLVEKNNKKEINECEALNEGSFFE